LILIIKQANQVQLNKKKKNDDTMARHQSNDKTKAAWMDNQGQKHNFDVLPTRLWQKFTRGCIWSLLDMLSSIIPHGRWPKDAPTPEYGGWGPSLLSKTSQRREKPGTRCREIRQNRTR
jgi:hypothetical protein